MKLLTRNKKKNCKCDKSGKKNISKIRNDLCLEINIGNRFQHKLNTRNT